MQRLQTPSPPPPSKVSPSQRLLGRFPGRPAAAQDRSGQDREGLPAGLGPLRYLPGSAAVVAAATTGRPHVLLNPGAVGYTCALAVTRGLTSLEAAVQDITAAVSRSGRRPSRGGSHRQRGDNPVRPGVEDDGVHLRRGQRAVPPAHLRAVEDP